jgi:hypothetical protein
MPPMCERVLTEYGAALKAGAIVVVEADRTRVRLPDADA